MRFAIINAGKVVNIAEAQPGFASEQGWIKAHAQVDIGWLWNGSTFSGPGQQPAPVPQSITPRQAKRALLAAGKLEAAEGEVIKAGRAAQIDWDSATEFRRDNVLIAGIGAALGLTESEIDDLFRAAAAIV